MMPELGKYADFVLGAYAASLVLILGLLALTVWQSRRMKRQLAEVEARVGKDNG